MCFGFDGDRALRESLARKGASRRSLLAGAAAGAVALGSTLGSAAPAAAHGGGHDHGRKRGIPHDRISIQMYTLRDAIGTGAGLVEVLDALERYGYEKVELAGLYDRTAAQMKELLDERGLRATSSHSGTTTTAAELQTKLETARTLGQKYVVVPWYPSGQTLSFWQQQADRMNEEAAAARRWGLRYGYHNHAHEFTDDLGGGVTPWEVLTDRLDPRLVHLEVDLYWAYTGGVESGAADPLKFAQDVIRTAPQRVRQYHVKDRAASDGDMADLGTGVIDFPAIFRKHQVEEYIVENDNPDVTPLHTAAVGHLYLDHVRF